MLFVYFSPRYWVTSWNTAERWGKRHLTRHLNVFMLPFDLISRFLFALHDIKTFTSWYLGLRDISHAVYMQSPLNPSVICSVSIATRLSDTLHAVTCQGLFTHDMIILSWHVHRVPLVWRRLFFDHLSAQCSSIQKGCERTKYRYHTKLSVLNFKLVAGEHSDENSSGLQEVVWSVYVYFPVSVLVFQTALSSL